MGIKGLSSVYDTTIDVNDGQATQTFEQAGNREFDVSVDPTSPTNGSITISYVLRSQAVDGGSDDGSFRVFGPENLTVPNNIDSIDYTITLNDGSEVSVDSTNTEKGGSSDSSLSGTFESGDEFSLSVQASEGNLAKATVDLTFNFSIGTSVNSISQA